jgi:transposase InsO family protein
VDAVSQWQVQACVQGISEAFLLPVLMLVMAQFPFEIEGFHSDNGSEYINGKVALMLEKLRIEQTKSRSRHSNDNALAESKNASVVQEAHGLQPHPASTPSPSMRSTRIPSTRGSICTGRACSPPRSPMTKARPSSATSRRT